MLDARPTSVVASTRDEYGKWRENVGSIRNAELLSTNHTVSSDEEGTERGNGKPTTNGNSQQQVPPSHSLRTDLKHGVDYFLLGPSAWLLVKEKFGYDKEIGWPCVYHSTNESTLSVAIGAIGGASTNQAAHQNFIPIPPAGYFPYQQLLSDLEGDSEEAFVPQPAHPHAPENFIERILDPRQDGPDTTQTTVSDDEGGENDLVRSGRASLF